MDESSLSHTRWDCKYHIVFAPKYRRKVIYGKLKKEIGMILRELCERKDVEIVEVNACADHIHRLVRIPPDFKKRSLMNDFFFLSNINWVFEVNSGFEE